MLLSCPMASIGRTSGSCASGFVGNAARSRAVNPICLSGRTTGACGGMGGFFTGAGTIRHRRQNHQIVRFSVTFLSCTAGFL